MNSGFEFKFPNSRSLGSKLAARQSQGADKVKSQSSISRSASSRPSTVTIFKKKSTLGRRRTQLYLSPNPSTPLRNLLPPSSHQKVKRLPDWAGTPGPEVSRFFENGISELGQWSAFKNGPKLNGVRTPMPGCQLPKRFNESKIVTQPAESDSEEETKRKLKALDKIPIEKVVTFSNCVAARQLKQEKETIRVKSPPISPLELKRNSSPAASSLDRPKSFRSQRNDSLSPRLENPASSLKRKAGPTKKALIRASLGEKLKELQVHAARITTLTAEIAQLQNELNDSSEFHSPTSKIPLIKIIPPVEEDDVNKENEDKSPERDERTSAYTPPIARHLAYTPRTLSKVYHNQYRDLFQ